MSATFFYEFLETLSDGVILTTSKKSAIISLSLGVDRNRWAEGSMEGEGLEELAVEIDTVLILFSGVANFPEILYNSLE